MGNAAAAKKIMVRGALSLHANFRCAEFLQKPFALKEPDRK
jgi:hypothetical protein